ncbi:MAG: glycoside hydrolase 43 family protein, partial [Treponema sp.]|nr:glycoside hydrolase 43 family protein [Treponema sp.]
MSSQSFYTNPVILSDYSDPDVIRVGKFYYMTASSFNYTPGLPLLMSTDLVHWKLVGYAVKNLPFEHFDSPLQSKGIWAPSLRYHEGRFIITVGLPDEGIFVTESEDFTGLWSPLRCVWKGKGFIDPCPFWDSEGKAYIIHAYAKSRIGFKSRLGLLEANPVTLSCKGEDSFIFFGEESQPTIEGPKVYERKGYVYILAPAGGVKCGWQTALRAKSIKGPFEEKIILSQGNSHINGPHQGGLVDSPDGKFWFLHFQDRGIYGRVTLLQPADWKDDWPLMGSGLENGNWPGEPVDFYNCPQSIEDGEGEAEEEIFGIDADECSDDFFGGLPGLQWQWQANHKSDFILFHDGKGLRLAALALGASKTIWDYPAVLSEKIASESFEANFFIDPRG